MKTIFTQGPFLTLRLAILLLSSVVLMTVDHRLSYLESARAGVATLLLPIQYVIELPVSAGRWVSDALSNRAMLLVENSELRDKQLLQAAKLQKLAALESENRRLRKLLNSAREIGDNVLIAELLGVDLDPYKHQVTLNKGSMHNVHVGQPILDAEGVMGQVIHVSPFSANAILITDPSHALPVQINRNGLRSLIMGTGIVGRLELQHLPNNADIRVGDLLVTSGLGGRFPAGYPVARVTEVRLDPGQPFADITAEPAAQINSSRELLLVWPAITAFDDEESS
ncbi:rod shape-determining protein MreC [Solemya pervernicosa gill symbiont]|uniref:Cell shape-determining protein MreC n=2 Tax=Gammaproteobacteria incertae sedis TaxID=118884 RepID=A0A1T2L4D4_9GAMM|nr:rod shape-determining protein MreC [Candidatus Reidiella endopervernicosa]OOZ39931.1 rod shape-determining protein MreC [Solemya pervernicosa gill symbiont]QKQ28188.1 rod shape-determining protein MreC [Candidatus Reidiella endopervernicosa]